MHSRSAILPESSGFFPRFCSLNDAYTLLMALSLQQLPLSPTTPHMAHSDQAIDEDLRSMTEQLAYLTSLTRDLTSLADEASIVAQPISSTKQRHTPHIPTARGHKKVKLSSRMKQLAQILKISDPTEQLAALSSLLSRQSPYSGCAEPVLEAPSADSTSIPPAEPSEQQHTTSLVWRDLQELNDETKKPDSGIVEKPLPYRRQPKGVAFEVGDLFHNEEKRKAFLERKLREHQERAHTKKPRRASHGKSSRDKVRTQSQKSQPKSVRTTHERKPTATPQASRGLHRARRTAAVRDPLVWEDPQLVATAGDGGPSWIPSTGVAVPHYSTYTKWDSGGLGNRPQLRGQQQ